MKKILALTLALVLALSLCACGGGNADTTTTDNGDAADTATVEIPPVEDLTGTDTSAIPGVEDGVLTVGMECAYAPYNWTQTDDSNGAVPIVNNPGSYANGYDVMIAQRICDTYGWKLEVQAIEWAGLIPALNAGTIDAVIADELDAVIYGRTLEDWIGLLFQIAPDGLGVEAEYLEPLMDFKGI